MRGWHGLVLFGLFGTFSVAPYPNGLAAGDFDQDGRIDLAAASNSGSPGTLSIVHNEGSGVFSAPIDFAHDWIPVSATSADLDGDGDPDLALVDFGASQISLRLNDGAGNFMQAGTLPVGPAYNLLAEDLDGDGDVDLAAASEGSLSIQVLLNQGQARFADALIYNTGGMAFRLEACDLDGDGDLDLISANGNTNNLGVFINEPAAASGDLNLNGVPDECETDCNSNRVPDSLEIAGGKADCNKNGVLDECEVGGVIRLGLPTVYAAGAQPESVSLLDVNGDGRLDLVAANFNSNNASVLLQKADGGFTGRLSSQRAMARPPWPAGSTSRTPSIS